MVALHEPVEASLREALAEHDDMVAGLLARRGVRSRDEADAFLRPSYEAHIDNPLLLHQMPRAVERIARAISAGERITVWSDYDCDGIPGGVILHDTLKKVGAHFSNYIPHRHEEGFGVNMLGVEKLAREGTKVLITVDCGITDLEPIEHATRLGMDVIVTDHHVPLETLPQAYAIVNPKQEGETYAFTDFCGGGLAWKLATALLTYAREQQYSWVHEVHDGWEKWLLDMAALATIADMVPLRGENRVIVKYGLMVMRKSPRIGFQKLCKVARVNQRFITEEEVSFMLIPRINAASRMGNPRDAFELLTTDDEARADMLAKELERVNRSRRAVAAATTRAAHERVEEKKMHGTLGKVIVLGDPSWRPGLLGLVANSLAQMYERPVFLWGREGGTSLKGSCRSGEEGVSVVMLMEEAKHCFIQYGGHHASGGFTVEESAVFSLEEELLRAYETVPSQAADFFEKKADILLSLSEVSHTLFTKLHALAPYGTANERPVLGFRHLSLTSLSWFGKANEHIKISVSDGAFTSLEGVAFFARRELGKHIDQLSVGKEVHVLAHLEREQFSKGRPLRLRILDVRH